MGLSKDLINQFVEATRPDKPVNTGTTVYGKTVEYNGKMYVQLDGSDLLTPVNTTTSLGSDERVSVTIQNHTATVTGNLSAPSASVKEVEVVSNKITELDIVVANKVSTEELSAERGRIDELVTENTVIKNTLTATNADIINLQADNVVVKETLEANEGRFVKIEGDIASIDAVSTKDLEAINADIHNLQATYAEFENTTTTNFDAVNAEIERLDSEKISADDLDAKYANIDFANIGMAAVEKFLATSGIIKDLVVDNEHVTGEIVGVTIKGDLIEGGTVVADKLVVLGENGLYYKLNVNGVTTEAEQTEYNSLNGSVITAKSITAEKVNVSDLVAFNATIGGFNITNNSIYSGAKASVDNTTQGIYMDDEGQMVIGDATNFLRYYKVTDDEGNESYKLEIAAESILFGVNSKSSAEDLASLIDYVKIGSYEDDSGDTKPCLELTEDDSDSEAILTNTEIILKSGDTIHTEINQDGIVANNVTINNELRFPHFAWAERANGNFGLMWKGGN